MNVPPVFSLDDLSCWERTGAGLSPPARLAVIGDPIAHSRSPQLHNPALISRGIEAQYIRVQVPPGSVKRSLDLFARHGFVGVNCTIPHKFEALKAMDVVDPLAATLGAVNTVLIHDGKLTGFNSDGPGFLRTVEEAFGRRVRDLRVLLLGAGGGAGRAVAVQCALEQCPSLVLVNRTLSKAEPLVAECRSLATRTELQTCPWSDSTLRGALENTDLIVNATPIGMKETDAPLIDPGWVRSSHLVLDMVYRAGSPTPLILAARAAGAKSADGLLLLLHQGAISFAHWFGEPVPLEAMRSGLSATS